MTGSARADTAFACEIDSVAGPNVDLHFRNAFRRGTLQADSRERTAGPSASPLLPARSRNPPSRASATSWGRHRGTKYRRHDRRRRLLERGHNRGNVRRFLLRLRHVGGKGPHHGADAHTVIVRRLELRSWWHLGNALKSDAPRACLADLALTMRRAGLPYAGAPLVTAAGAAV